jgi:hypothetical protein
MASSAPFLWSFRQRFSWRPSTLLLAYVIAFAAVGSVQPWLPGMLQSAVTWAQETLGPGAVMVWFPAAILALTFFIGSLVKRNPQLQFLLEVLIAVGIVLLTPTY